MLIYHITTRTEWIAHSAGNLYHPESLATEGFIHASTKEQLTAVANNFYTGQSDLVLLCVDATRVVPQIRYEDSGQEQYPHICGPLNLDAVIQVVPLLPEPDGSFRIPATLPFTS